MRDIVIPSHSDYPATYSDELRAYLEERAVKPHVAIARGYRAVRPGKPGKSSDDEDFAFTYGFPQARGGFNIPLYPLLGGDQKYQLRHHPSDIARTKRVPKFRTPNGQANCLVTSPMIPRERLREKEALIHIAEGVTRVDALAGYDVPAVGILGAFGWRGTNEVGGLTALPDFAELAIKGGRFVIALDGDITTNPKIAQAAFMLKSYLIGRGADKVHILALPNGEGLDDWIARERFEDQKALLKAAKTYCLNDEQEADLAKSHTIPRGADSLPNTTVGLREGLGLLGVDVQHNVRTQDTEWRKVNVDVGQPDTDKVMWKMLDDRAAQHIIELLEERFYFSEIFGSDFVPRRYQLPRSRFYERLDGVLFHREVDPFKEWIESLDQWDEVRRLDKLFVNALGVAEDDLSRAAAKILIVAVRRCYKEWSYDHVPILIGAQGAAKTSFVRQLIPPGVEFASWFVDAVELGGKEKELQEKAGGAVVVELSEMSSIKAADREQLKTLITQKASTIRLSYRRNPERYVRRYVLIGTANPSDYSILPFDNTGYRRFIPLYVSDDATYESVCKYLGDNRDQLWAEAYHRHRAGEETHLPKELEQETSRRATELAPPDVIGSAVEELTRKMVGTGAASENTTVKLLAEAELVEKDSKASAPKTLRTEFMGKLRYYGWTYATHRFKTENNTVKKVWCPPDTLPADLQAAEVVGGQNDPTIELCFVCSEGHPYPDQTANRLPQGQLRCADTEKCSQRAHIDTPRQTTASPSIL